MKKIPWKQIYKQYQTKCHRKRSRYPINYISSTIIMKLDNDGNFNMIINCEILKNLTESPMKCQIYDSDVVFSIDISKQIGLCNTIDLKCSGCSWKYSFETSYQTSKRNSKMVESFMTMSSIFTVLLLFVRSKKALKVSVRSFVQ